MRDPEMMDERLPARTARRATALDDQLEPVDPGIDWGVGDGPWLWRTELRILFVIDGRINIGSESTGDAFGLGPVLETLRDWRFAWWVRIRVDIATRDGEQREVNVELEALLDALDDLRDQLDIFGEDTPPDPLAGIRYFGFRFTQPGFDIDTYDQVWFFGDHPGVEFDNDENDDSGIPQDRFHPLSDEELVVVAEWMDRGGGVFATGDHGTLGASMSHRIPRVRSMRRWTHAQGVPMKHAASRHETLQHFNDPDYPSDEDDPWPQPIEPVYRMLDTWPPSLGSRVPHPLLCAVDGVITRFPDHMHEGSVFDDGQVVTNAPLDIPGYEGSEYPPTRPVVLAALAGGPLVDDAALGRPVPQVIAYGRTTNSDAPSERFPLVGVYDGDPARIGRIVVDSTWHHWFSLNVVPLRDHNRPVYRRMQSYYRNVALWLASPYQRSSMLIAACWGAMVASEPMDFDIGMDVWQLGAKALDVIGRTAPQCTVSDWVSSMEGPGASMVMAASVRASNSTPLGSPIPAGAVEHAIVGGIALGLRELALDYQKTRAHGGRPSLRPDAIREEAIAGAREGNRALVEAMKTRAARTTKLGATVAKAFEPPEVDQIRIPIETVTIRVIPERLQFPDPTDPVLADGVPPIVVRLRVNGREIGRQTVELTGDAGPDGIRPLDDADATLPELTVQTGERLTIECEAATRRARSVIRFRESLAGHPTEWLGSHSPSRRQLWRLWYRIERADDTAVDDR